MISATALLINTAAAFANEFGGGYGTGGWMGPGMMGWGYGMGWFWTIIMAVFWVAVIAGIILLIRWLVLSTRTTHTSGIGEFPLDILKKRDARSKIDREELEEKKKALS
ncbi:hypothetical protein BMS3Bbin06_01472 [bacterium BMS3Bbin06]|nr:hypothetical protein BMS3Abin07_01189 [bacterium BMS3Abin07]GBE32926.1 hypothetical protein BMS3Bbin05_01856 [bacterium BMS3Bbin05]GBE34938.1 hypothetical protein BMS3Bbin06_01472 [bacterium BMS3Bbin06]